MEEELIYGSEYDCFLDGKYIGTATFVNDINIGDSFIQMIVDESGKLVNHVLTPDSWILKKN